MLRYRTYSGVFIPRHNIVPANPQDSTWIYEHIDCVPMVIKNGARSTTPPAVFFGSRNRVDHI